MPSALETLVKILKLERQQGCKNNAVIGGLSAFGTNWKSQAYNQARKPEQRVLIDEMSDLMHNYDLIEDKALRANKVTYMLDRITGRLPAPEEYAARLSAHTAEMQESGAGTALETERDAGKPQRQEHERGRSDSRGDRSENRDSDVQTFHDVSHEAASPTVTDRNTEARESHAEAPPVREQPRKKDRPKEQPKQQQQRPPQRKERQGAPSRSGGKSYRGGDGDDDDDDRDSGGGEQIFDPNDGLEATYTGQLDLPTEARLARPPRTPRREMEPEEAADIIRGLSALVGTMKGIGPHNAQLLEKLDVRTINDLLFMLPRRYDDYTKLSQIARLYPGGVVTVIGTVRKTEIHIGRNNRKDFFMEVDDGSGSLTVIFFGQHFLVRSLRAGMQIVLSGSTSVFNGRIRMTSPEWEELDSENLHTVGIVPVYPLTEGLKGRRLRRLMRDAVYYWAERLPDYVPNAVLERTELGDLGWTLKQLHFPEGWDHLQHARSRYVFDQLLIMQLAILANRRQWQSVPGIALTLTDDFMENFIASAFPYPLTGAQRRAIEDIRRDVTQDIPMNRLLQGDVGAGKTAVATTALAMALANGKQGALMAPTSILAEQHYRGLSAMFERIPLEMLGGRRPVIGLLTGSLTATEREAIYNGLADGSIDIIIGTHALIQGGVTFKDLAIAVIDEQHRFGVEQRGSLRGKGTNPHLLVMTATPIPRTLALTMYADLDLSVMDEMPPGRIPIRTRIVYQVERERMYSFVESQLNQGRQAFFVHPLVEASENSEAKAAVDEFDRLSDVFHHHKVGLLHGRMKPSEKDDIMTAFSKGDYDVLVTTSVAEVGVDVPNASVIVIEGANRFGLAQLHQFRGRVGRGQHASYCLLLPDTEAPEALERLHALEMTTDGFKLAEIDWRQRGSGDLVGTRQSGRGDLKLLEWMSPELVELAQREARTIYAEDPDLQLPQHYLLAQRVAQIYSEESDLS